MSIRILSDLHLGAEPHFAHPGRQAKLYELLKSWQGSECVIFAGDIFEFWMEYRDYIAKEHFEFIFALRELIASGTQVHMISGNHDFDLGQFFKGLGIICHPSGHMQMDYLGKKLYIGHGDGWAQSDWKYRIVRKIIRHPLSGWAFRLLHPDWGMGLARYVGSTSRDHGKYEQIPFAEYEAYAAGIHAQGYDVVIHGHLHHDILKQLENGIYACNGPWLDRLCWTEIEPQGLCQYELNLGKTAEILYRSKQS